MEIRILTLKRRIRPKKAKKIALTLTSFDKGGLEQVVLNLYRYLKSKKITVFLFIEEDRLGTLADQVEDKQDIVVFARSRLLFLDALKNLEIDIVHYHHNLFSSRILPYLGIRSVYTIHNAYTWLDKNAFSLRLNKLKKIDQLVSVSNWVKKYFCDRSHISLDKVTSIVNGLNTSEFVSINTGKNRPSIGLREEDFVFINIASFHRTKNQTILISAMEKLIKENERAKLIMIGNIGDQKFYDEIQLRLTTSSARDNIVLLNYAARDEIANLLKNVADCFVLPSLQEGCANVVLEAMYFEKPMILTDVGNASDVIHNEDTGIIIKNAFDSVLDLTTEDLERLSKNLSPENLPDLTNAMERIMKDPKVWKSKAAIGHKLVLERYSLNEMGERYLNIYQKL